jgi:hypothetical protein
MTVNSRCQTGEYFVDTSRGSQVVRFWYFKRACRFVMWHRNADVRRDLFIYGGYIPVTSNFQPERIQGHAYSIRSDLWSLGITLMEVAQARFPFPPPGHPPLSMIDLVQYLLEADIAGLLEDDPQVNLRWSPSIRHFLSMW